MNIVLIDDQTAVLEHVGGRLKRQGHDVHFFSTESDARAFLKDGASDIGTVLMDLDLGDGVQAGLEFLGDLREILPRRTPIFILSGKGTVRLAVESLRRGADDFLEKGINLDDYLDAAIHKAENLRQFLSQHEALAQQRDTLLKQAAFYAEEARRKYSIIGQSSPLTGVLEEARRAANLPRPMLIRGERGTGKELLAAYIHYSGTRNDEPFVTVNCAALSGNLLESEIFGHEKGAFTGAAERRIGRFELADRGTLFLDEIGNMSVDFQKKMLRVIEYQSFERVQGTETIHVDVRVIAATNADLEAMIGDGSFRVDLYDRLAFQTLHVPPLRVRKEDIPRLVEHFAEAMAAEVAGVPHRRFSDSAIGKLQECDWPGNVRELRYLVERTVCMPGPDTIEADDIIFQTAPGRQTHAAGNFDQSVLTLQRELIVDAMKRHNNNQKLAAASLGLTYDQFRHYWKKFRT